jgi:hypothetical protein
MNFWNFITIRHRIWHCRRFNLPFDNPFDRRITNVYRILDTGTIYAVSKILEGCETLEEAVRLATAYRIFNKIDTFERLRDSIQTYDFNQFEIIYNQLAARAKKGSRMYGDAYCPTGVFKCRGNTALNVWKSHFEKPIRFDSTVEGLYHAFNKSFTGYQICLDLMYPLVSKGGQGHLSEDSNWFKVGPGAKRGIQIVGRQIPELYEIQVDELASLDFDWLQIFGKPVLLSMSDLEHCLCEYQKLVNWPKRMRRYKSRPVPDIGWTIPYYMQERA